jgi:hypothetical protein
MALTRLGPNNSTNISGINLTSQVTGTLPVANGGTALSSGFVNGGVSSPMFQAKLTSVGVDFSEGSLTTLVMNSEDFDTDNAYDTSTGQFTPQTAGKYFCEVFVHADRGGSTMSDLKMAYVQLFKNSSGSGGKATQQHDMRNNYGRGFGVNVSAIFDLNGSSDYVYPVLSIQTNSGSDPKFTGESSYTYFRAFKLIGV